MQQVKTVLTGLLMLGFIPHVSQLKAQSTAFGVDSSTWPVVNFVSLPLPAGGPITTIGATVAGQGADFGPGGVFYTTAASNLMTLSLTTGAFTVIGTVTGLDAAHMPIIGMAYHESSGTTYVTGHKSAPFDSELYTFDLATGVATLIGTVTNTNFLITLAVNCSGELYGIDAENNNLLRIDPATAEGTVIGPLNFTAGFFAQDMDFDPVTGILYWSAFTGTTGELRTIDLATGNSSLAKNWSADMGVFAIQGDCSATSVGQIPLETPDEFKLLQNYPNPFNPATTLSFELEFPSPVTLKIYNTKGQLVRTLVNDKLSAGAHSVRWDGRNQQGAALASGIYVWQIQAGFLTKTKKMTLLQ